MLHVVDHILVLVSGIFNAFKYLVTCFEPFLIKWKVILIKGKKLGQEKLSHNTLGLTNMVVKAGTSTFGSIIVIYFT